MNCESCQDQMVDVLYGEEMRSRVCFEFFQHLDQCETCQQEYEELLGTRSLLANWTIDEEGETAGADLAWSPLLDKSSKSSWWTSVLKIAATFLILVGAFAIVDRLGLAGSDRKLVSQTELMEMVNDLIVVSQSEERKVIRRALMEFADELTARQRSGLQQVSQDLQDLDRRYIQVMEETTEYLGALATR